MRALILVTCLVAVATAMPAAAQDKVSVASLDGRNGEAGTPLDAYLFRPARPGPVPAVVFLHGCGGLVSGLSHRIMSREVEWAGTLNAAGYAVLMVDSLTTRNSGEMCSRSGFKDWLYKRRPADAYGGLLWLQRQPFVRPDRIAAIGWSNGGGAVLYAVASRSPGRPQGFAGPDFRAAVAFYPGSCSKERLGSDWTTAIPLMILVGEKDVWTPAAPCRELADTAARRGAPVTFHAYENAYHDFDWPNLKRRELTAYTTSKGVVPITGEDPASHEDATRRVRAFLGSHL
jgi:dienelactone hydrolase